MATYSEGTMSLWAARYESDMACESAISPDQCRAVHDSVFLNNVADVVAVHVCMLTVLKIRMVLL